MIALTLLIALSQAKVAEERLRPTELSLGLTGVGSGYTFRGGRFGDFAGGPDVRATALINGFTVNGAFLYSLPFDTTGVAAASTLTARLGYTGTRFQILAGAVLQLAPGTEPNTQILPSLRAEAKFTRRLRFGLALFESHGFSPLQLTWEQDNFFAGLVLPIGLTAGGRVELSEELLLDVRFVAFRLYNAELAMLTVSGVIGGSR